MNHKKWVLALSIIVPILLASLRIFQPSQPQPAGRMKITHILVPPLEVLFRYFDFNERNALRNWEEKIFRGRVTYELDFEGSSGFVHSKSLKTASAIFYRIKFDLAKYPYLYWKWHIGKFPDKHEADNAKKRDDYAGRVYVIFTSRFFTHFRCLEYIWDETLPEGAVMDSPYSNQIKQLVVQTGPSRDKEWVAEGRNIFQDYEKLFGEKPKMKVAAIALMTDSEGTETEAEGFFDDIQIGVLASGPRTDLVKT